MLTHFQFAEAEGLTVEEVLYWAFKEKGLEIIKEEFQPIFIPLPESPPPEPADMAEVETIPPPPADWKGESEQNPSFRAIASLSPPVHRKIEPYGAAFLAHVRKSNHIIMVPCLIFIGSSQGSRPHLFRR